MTDQTPVAATPRRRWPENCELDDVEEIEQDDDRNWDADQPQENTAHGPFASFQTVFRSQNVWTP
jgi:hypothetical protein